MRRKGLLLVIGLLALATLMAAMSFTSATLKASANLKITTADNGLVALLPGDGTSVGNEGQLSMDFTDGTDKGIQPGSIYTWNNLFQIKNNSNAPMTISLIGVSNLNQYVDISFMVDGKNVDLATGTVTVAPNHTITIDATLDATKDKSKKLYDGQDFSLQVVANQ